MTYAVGARVRFTTNALGTLNAGTLSFTDHIVGVKDEGEVMTYAGQLPDGWLAVRPDAYPDEWVPVDPSMIEAA